MEKNPGCIKEGEAAGLSPHMYYIEISRFLSVMKQNYAEAWDGVGVIKIHFVDPWCSGRTDIVPFGIN